MIKFDKKRTAQVAIMIIAGLVLTGCSFVRIQNTANAPVQVLVRVPDSGGGYSRHIRSGDIVDVFSSHGGSYTVTIVPSEQYKATLESLRDQITKRLFEERATLTGAEVAQLVENLSTVDNLMDDLAVPGASCRGSVPDFDTAVVVIVWDEVNSQWTLSCS